MHCAARTSVSEEYITHAATILWTGGIIVIVSLLSIIAGAAMSFQGVINTRLGERIGTMHANAFVQGTAFALSAAALLFVKNGGFSGLGHTPAVYLSGGAIGLVITLTVMLGVRDLGPALSVSIILIAQLLTAAVIEAFGWLGSERAPFCWNKYAGLALMIAGVIIFKRR